MEYNSILHTTYKIPRIFSVELVVYDEICEGDFLGGGNENSDEISHGVTAPECKILSTLTRDLQSRFPQPLLHFGQYRSPAKNRGV